MKKIITFLCLLFLSVTTWGQTYDLSIPVMSPEAASLGRFGAYPISYYTGTPDISIPLYQLNVHNLEIPITLQYDASGFIPNKDSGKVGHDWVLMAGGVITRSVNSVPDEFWTNFGERPNYGVHGHWYAIKELNRKLNEDSVRTLKYITTPAANGIDFETTPDMFSFNFGKHRGQFFIAHDGTPKVVSDGNYRIDLTNFAIQHMGQFTVDSSISITTDDGTKYTFGGSPESLEIALRLRLVEGEVDDLMEDTYNGVINAFYLTSIETPDGEKVEFIYKTYEKQTSQYVDDDNIVKNCYYADGANLIMNYPDDFWSGSGATLKRRYTFTKVAYLSEICSSAGTVTFNYMTKEYPFCDTRKHFWNKKTLRLDNILVTNNDGTLVKGIKLYHSYFVANDNTSYRMFLTDILCGKEKYSFTYTEQKNLPRPETRGIDLRGYYNGYDNNRSLLTSKYVYNPDQVDFSHRQPDFNCASKAMLKRITYPTGGYTEFTFENHQYGTRMHRVFTSPDIVNDRVSGMVGGLRIKEIRNVPGEVRTFTYETESPETKKTISSGVFSDLKTYAILAHFEHISLGINAWFISEASNVVHANSFSESEIVYSRVTETYGTGNGKTVYDYSTYLDHPDLPTLGSGTYAYYKQTALTNDQKNLLRYMLAYTSQRIKRGKLQSLTEYAEGNTLPKRKTTYTYTVKGNMDAQAVYAAEVRMLIVSQYGICNSQAFYYYPYQLTREVVEEYSGSQCLTRQTDYVYNDHNKQLKEVRTIGSDGVVHRTEYSYPADNMGETACAAMVGRFMVAPVIYEKQYAGNALLKTRHNKYALFQNTFYALSSVEEAYGNGPYHTLVTFHDYDKRRNLLSFTERGKPTEVFLWGYGYQYPVIRMVNASLDAVRRHAGASALDTLADEPAPKGKDTLLADRLAAAFPSAQITTYEYNPLVGMTAMKNLRGLRHTYNYDVWGRLQELYVDGKRVQELIYNHTHTASALSASFGSSASSYDQGTQTFSMNVSGGSDVYDYKWVLKDSNGKQVDSSTYNTLTYTFREAGSYTLTCTVSDLITHEEVTKSRSFTINQYGIKFSNISYSSSPYSGDASTRAIINCQKPTTIEFRMEYRVKAASPTTHFECRIGNYFHSGSGRGKKDFTLTLPQGKTNVSLDLFNIYPESMVELYIVKVSTEGCQVGSPDFLEVAF
ncbi:PKD domain-containing protein [Bacteroides heparinolyticus]|uniref:PKD domain-containing protein n=1 Tax=Prevotella heparinolytica TaxID=28113 RepID=UPI0028E80F7A|nr:PKD domain-containing protein [Bacteroides heparinolyticus]